MKSTTPAKGVFIFLVGGNMRLDFVIEVGAGGTGTLRYSKGGTNKGSIIEGLLTKLYASNANGQTGPVTIVIREVLPFDTPITLYTFTALALPAAVPLQAASYGRAGAATGMSVHETIHGVLEVTVTGANEGKFYASLGMLENGPE